MAVTKYSASSEGQNRHVTLTCACTNAVGTSAEIEVKAFKRGCMEIPSGSAYNLVTWYATTTSGSTAVALKDKANAAVTQVVAANTVYEIKDAVFACGYVVPVMTGAASGNVVFHFERG